MHATKPDQSHLIQLIIKAFANVKYPGDGNLLHPENTDNDDIRHLVGHRQWQHIPGPVIEKSAFALALLSGTAFAFYLPAFLLWAVENRYKSNAYVINSTIYGLNPIRRGKLDRYVVSHYAALDEDQRRAVIAFLNLIASDPGKADAIAARKALTDYWTNSVG